MPVPDQVRNDGSGIQNISELLDFPMSITGMTLETYFRLFKSS